MMTLTLNLPVELESLLLQTAKRQGLPVEALALKLLEASINSEHKRTEAVNLLQSWIDNGDAEEQQETGQFLTQALDADRLSDRKLFPAEMEGISW